MSDSILEGNIASPKTPGNQFFQPFEVTEELKNEADRRIAQFPDGQQRSAVMPILHHIQHHHGYLSAEGIQWTADRLGIEPVKVLEVVTFYPGFRQSAPGKFHVRICRTLSCAMAGSYELMERVCELAGLNAADLDPHHHPIIVSACGTWSVEFAECLASCGTGPVVLINDDFHEAVAPDRAADLMKTYA